MTSQKIPPTRAGAGEPGGSGSFADLFEKSMGAQELSEGEIVTGNVVKITNDFVVVDIGYKCEGAVPRHQFERGGQMTVQPGAQVRVFIDSLHVNEQGYCQLSKNKADRLRIWDEIANAFAKNAIVEGQITSRVKGGYEVDIGVKAFLPASQVDIRMPKNLDQYLNQTGQFRIIKFNQKRGNVVLSRRAVLEEQRSHMRDETLKALVEGAIVTGTVKNLTEYGAFVDLGGLDGLLHISDISWARIKHPSEKIKPGDEVRVKVLQFNRETGRVSLGLKQLEADPWTKVETDWPIGTRTRGAVTNIVDYGGFVEIAPGIEGLIHVSEMSWTRKVRHPSQILKVGDVVDVMVLDIDKTNRRVSLGMKQVMPNPWDVISQKLPPGSHIKGEIKSITDFGIFVNVEEGIDGLVHISDVTWAKKPPVLTQLFQKGQEVEAVVLNIDREGQRLSLGIKQLSEDPWVAYTKAHRKGALVDCKIVSVTDFGVFVELADGIEGLIRMNELSRDPNVDPKSLAEIGKQFQAEIVHIDTTERKISLSVKAMERSQERADLKRFISSQGDGRASLGDVLGEQLRAAAARKEAASTGTEEDSSDQPSSTPSTGEDGDSTGRAS
ncbi:MAG: 30S ribosomal protein S1 [Bdellovibrionota bacterium]